jgi:hypothetical protein
MKIPEKIKDLPHLTLFFYYCIAVSLNLITGFSIANQLPDYDISHFGAIGDGITVNTEEIQSAIDKCHVHGGGKVVVPPGVFVTGTVILKDGVFLYFSAGAELKASSDLNDFPSFSSNHPSYSGTFETYKSIIHAEDAENIGILGFGVINGNGDFWVDGPYGTPSFSLRPRIIQFTGCDNVTIRDVKLVNSASWVQYYQSCTNLLIDGITVDSRENPDIEDKRYHLVPGRNTDGLDLIDCSFVRVSNSFINSGDDAICIKSFDPAQGSRHITVSNCTVSSNASGIKIGTESSGAFEDITISNVTVYDTRNDAVGLMTVDGATMSRINVNGVTAHNIKGSVIFVRLGKRNRVYRPEVSPNIGEIKDIMIRNVLAENVSGYGCSITGLADNPLRNIQLSNISIRFNGADDPLDLFPDGPPESGWPTHMDDVPEEKESYPRGKMFGRLPAYGFFVRHVDGIRFDNIFLDVLKDEDRPALMATEVQHMFVVGSRMKPNAANLPVIWLKNVQHVDIGASGPIGKADRFLRLTGENRNIQLGKKEVFDVEKWLESE